MLRSRISEFATPWSDIEARRSGAELFMGPDHDDLHCELTGVKVAQVRNTVVCTCLNTLLS